MRTVIEIKSAEGDYFVIGRSGEDYYLKNKYTEIPNEFGVYSMEDVKKLFDELCDRIPECDEADTSSGHDNSCMWVKYSDGTEKLYKETEWGMNLSAFTARTALYSEFFQNFLFGRSELMTLNHLREVCENGKEEYKFFLRMIKDYMCDDVTFLEEEIKEDGSTEIRAMAYGVNQMPPITLETDGMINGTGNIKYIEMMKRNNVYIQK